MSELKTSRRETFEIRPYQEADLESVMQIVEIAWAPIYAGYREAMGDELYFAFYLGVKRAKVGYRLFYRTLLALLEHIVIIFSVRATSVYSIV